MGRHAIIPVTFATLPFAYFLNHKHRIDLDKFLGPRLGPTKRYSVPGPTDGPFPLWSSVARHLSQQKSLSLVDTARLFALIMAAIHDSLLTSHSSKAVYRLWRPETAIANADLDNNPATDPEPGWTPLVPTPPYPAYSSDMTCAGTGAAVMLAHVLGSDRQTFAATWYTASGSVVFTQPYARLSQLASDEAHSRIWGGIHYRFDIEGSAVSCTQVANYLFDNYMRPTRESDW